MGSGAFLVEACRFLGEKLVEAWNHHRELPTVPPDEDPSLYARRLVAQQCLYGVDINPFATDLAKLSLWLATLAKDHPFTFLDHALRSGDSLLGFDRVQIAQFHWDKTRPHERVFGQERLEKAIERVTAYRKEILEMAEDNVASDLLKQQKLGLAEQTLETVRRAGDLLSAAFLLATKDKERLRLRDNYRDLFLSGSGGNLSDLMTENETLRGKSQQRPRRVPFHWEIEFPEVFLRENPGFDSFVGNPPFLGGSKLSTVTGKSYMDWLAVQYSQSHGKSDLVAYFFRRAFDLLRNGATLGFIATNTIRQGDTRYTGLRWIRISGGQIYSADTRRKWPGRAAVVVSVVHIVKDAMVRDQSLLNGNSVSRITSYLFHFGPDENPFSLAANQRFVHSGTNINGKGFVLSPQEREQLINEDPRSQERIRMYLGAEEMNESPQAAPSRYVIDMEGLTEEEVKSWPALYRRLYGSVRIQRADSNEERLRARWWQYSRPAKELYAVSEGMDRILASGRAGSHISFVFQQPQTVFSDSLTLFVFDNYAGFCVLQSRVHEVWARFFGSSLKDDIRYIPEDCFETFPFPEDFVANQPMERSGREYYEFRSALMARNNEGLTKTYNRFHDPEEADPESLRLRQLHAALDRAVLDAYGWIDIRPTCEFVLDYEEPESEQEDKHKGKKPFRYRWPDEIRDEVLARLLELNRLRAREEQLSGAAVDTKSKANAHGKPRSRKRKASGTGSLLTDSMGEGKS